MLMKKVVDYLALRRAAGYTIDVPEYHLRDFARFAAQREETLIRTPTVIDWASQAHSLNQREHRLQTVLRFAQYLQAEDQSHEVPPRGAFSTGLLLSRRHIPDQDAVHDGLASLLSEQVR